MKANELMIGDLVYYTINNGLRIGTVYTIFQRRVDIKPNNKTAILCYDDDILQIEPIPLTAEILEKNGFEKEEYGLIWKSSHNFCDINGFPRIYAWVSFWKKGCIREVEISNIDTFYKDKIKQSNTYYVHQLQHALRLCGIEKEITL